MTLGELAVTGGILLSVAEFAFLCGALLGAEITSREFNHKGGAMAETETEAQADGAGAEDTDAPPSTEQEARDADVKDGE